MRIRPGGTRYYYERKKCELKIEEERMNEGQVAVREFAGGDRKREDEGKTKDEWWRSRCVE